MKTTSAGRSRIGQRNGGIQHREPLLKSIAACLRKAFPPLLFGAIPLAEAATIVTDTGTSRTLNSDSAYIVLAGHTIQTSAGDTIIVNGISPVQFTNQGTILNSQGSQSALAFNVAGTFVNNAGASLVGTTNGVYMSGGGLGYNVTNNGDVSARYSHAIRYSNGSSGTIENYGTINSDSSVTGSADGIVVDNNNGALVTINNHTGASIRSGAGNTTYGDAVRVANGGNVTLINDGTLSGYNYGINAQASSAVLNITNNSGGLIQGETDGAILLQSNSSITNIGTILANSGPAIYLSGNNNTVTLKDGGGTITGDVISAGTNNTLKLSGEGTLSSVLQNGSTFSGFQSLVVDTAEGKTWTADMAGMSFSGTGTRTVTVGGSGTFVLTDLLSMDNNGGTYIDTGATLQLGDGGSSGMVAGDIINYGTLRFDRGDDVTYSGLIRGSGELIKDGSGKLTLTRIDKYSYTGAVTVDNGILYLRAADLLVLTSRTTVNQNGTLDISGYGQTVNNLSGSGKVLLGNSVQNFNQGIDTEFSGVISGAGGLEKRGSGTLTLSGANNYNGGTTVYNNKLRLTGNASIGTGSAVIYSGATLFIDAPSSGSYLFRNALYSTGLLQVNLSAASDVFSFSASVGSNFAGTVQLEKSTFLLSGNNTSALTGATLQLASGNTTNVGAGTQTIGGLNLNDGSLRFSSLDNDGVINTSGTVALDAGTVAVDYNALVDNIDNYSLLQRDEGIDYNLITAGNITGSTSNLTLTDLGGNALNSNPTINIEQDSGTVAIGTYDFTLDNNASNLYARYVLTQLALQSGMTTTLSGDATTPSGANELHAKLTGAGNLAIDATTSITLNNNTNDYTGSTTVNAGTLILGSDSALGNTSNLVINSGTTVDVNGKTQTIGALNGAGGLNMNAGNLDITNGGLFRGIISGSAGSLALTGGSLTLTGNNTYTGTTTVDNGVTLQIGNSSVSGGYAGDIVDNGSVIFYSGAYDGEISGSGEVIKNGSGTLNLSGISSYSGGTDINAGTVIASNGSALGTGIINNAGSLQLNFAADSTLVNTLSGNGSLIKAGSGTATLTGTGSQQGIINVNAGTLAFAQNGAFEAITFRAANGATTSISANSTLNLRGEFFQATGATLKVAAGSNEPAIRSNTTYLNGTLNIIGYSTVAPGVASLLSNADFTVISSSQLINGDFSTANVSGVTSPDYLTIAGRKSADGKNYNIGYGLTWLEGTAKGNGVFTLTNSSDVFNVDVTLADRIGPFDSGWDGKTLTKAGAGTLTLSAANTYSGGTVINAGTVIATNANALGSGAVNNSGILQLDFAVDGTLTNLLNGNGMLTKTGSGTATLTGVGSHQGDVNVNAGILAFAQTGVFNAASLSTASGATTRIAADSTLNLSGVFTQSNGSTLDITLGTPGSTVITADSAALSGTLDISNFDVTRPTKASEANSNVYTIIHTTNGISGDFASVNLNGASSAADYLTLFNGKSVNNKDYNIGFGLTWLAGTTKGNGNFTLADGSTFEVDIALTDQTGPFSSTWDGKSLTKLGDGTLILSAVNAYTGNTNINNGMLQTRVIDAFAQSSNVSIASGATLAMDDYSQTARNLSGSGDVSTGNNAATVLTVDSTANSTFSGAISGAGSLTKTGNSVLTLSGVNSYSGGTTISNGKIIATNGSALGSNTVTNNAELELAFVGDGTLSNKLAGSGILTKNGNNTVVLTGTGSQQGTVNVNAGTLSFAQTGLFNATSLTTASGATTSLATGSKLGLGGALTQNSGSTLSIDLTGNNDASTPLISAATASLAGTLSISGFGAVQPSKSSELTNTQYTIIQTTGSITGDFTNISFGGAASTVDYLTLFGGVTDSNTKYKVGFGLSWLAGEDKSHGTFTLADGNTFEADTVLTNQSGTFTSGWDGQSLTKAGEGTLILSAANTYSGNTNINAGTLQTGVIDAFKQSAQVSVAGGATLNLNGFNQTANNLNGAGTITLGSATLTANNNVDTTFSGAISGTGSLTKTGSSVLTLSGVNSYSGGTTINDGKIIVTNGGALGSNTVTNNNTAALELAFTDDGTNWLVAVR